MDKNKTLWIIVAVGVFMLIVSGTALFLYSPSRNSGTQLSNSLPVQNITSRPAATTADPDSWVRDPSTTPGLVTDTDAPRGDINLTIVTGQNNGGWGTVDVNGITRAVPPAVTETSSTSGVTATATATATTAAATAATGTAPAVSASASAGTTTVTRPATTTQAAPRTTASATTTARPRQPAPVTVTQYWIQTGSFSSKLNAEKARTTLGERHLSAEIFTKLVSGATTYRVRVGPYQTKAEADYWLRIVKDLPDFSSSYVSEVKTSR